MITLYNDLPEDKKVNVKYEEQERDCLFDVKLSYKASREFAILFVNKDGSFYTAKIAKGASSGKLTISKKRIEKSVMIRIVDIENDQEVFSAPFGLGGRSANEDRTETEAYGGVGELKELNNSQLQVSEEDFLNTESPVNVPLQTACAVSAVIEPKNERELRSVEEIQSELFGEFAAADEGITLNGAPEAMDEVFSKFTGYESVLKNHIFYMFDKKISAEHELKIQYNGEPTALNDIFGDYTNPFIKDSAYPKELVGRVELSGKSEYFVFAVLGRHLKEEQPFAGATGFMFFHKLPGSELGYWMSYISALSGNLCLPSGA